MEELSLDDALISYFAQLNIKMPRSKSIKGGGKRVDGKLSTRTEKQIDSLPVHAQHIYKEAYANAIELYKNPEKRRGGKKQSIEEVAHKVAWAAVKKKYVKKGNKWIRKNE